MDKMNPKGKNRHAENSKDLAETIKWMSFFFNKHIYSLNEEVVVGDPDERCELLQKRNLTPSAIWFKLSTEFFRINTFDNSFYKKLKKGTSQSNFFNFLPKARSEVPLEPLQFSKN